MNYCKKCGTELAKSNKRRGFDRSTGKPTYEFEQRCPNKRMFVFGHTHMYLMYNKEWADLCYKAEGNRAYRGALRESHFKYQSYS